MPVDYRCPDCFAPIAHGQKMCDNCRNTLNWAEGTEDVQIIPDNNVIQQLAEPPRLYQQPVRQMNWFKRHLNWTWILFSVVGPFVVSIIIGFIAIIIDPYFLLISEDAIEGLAWLIAFGAMLGVGCWVLSQKKRSLWWILIIFVPIGWIIFLCLENRNREV